MRAPYAAKRSWTLALFVALVAAISGGCGDDDGDAAAGGSDGGASDAGDATTGEPTEGVCEHDASDDAPAFLSRIGCRADFDVLASQPLDNSIPGARSVKVVFDPVEGTLYFQNTKEYPRHFDFAKAQLASGSGAGFITTLAAFNDTQYTTNDRRYYLGAVTYYEEPNAWVFEIATNDTASPAMITELFGAVRDAVYFGSVLGFHPTSDTVELTAGELADDIEIVTTTDLFADTDYQPLNLATAVGQLRFLKASALENTYVGYRDIVVLDEVPNDISVVAGMITEVFQTPLSHVNILAQNRKTPNMGLRRATTNPQLLALSGKWVKLTVGAFEWSIEEVTEAEADAFWEAHKPEAITLLPFDLETSDLRDIEDVTEHTDTAPYVTLAAIKKAVAAYGAKAANYSVFSTDPKVPSKKAFAIPLRYYVEFMEQHGFFDRVAKLQADASFVNDPAVRDEKLATLRDDIEAASLDPAFEALVAAKLAADYPGRSIRFRTSTNAEDLGGFPCAGCYDSHTGDPAEYAGDQLAAARDAIRKTWATVWKLRTYEEREYHSIDHTSVAMALLVHTNFPNEEANGVAITANPYDPTGSLAGFYVNVQKGGDVEVVAPPPGITSESFIYQFDAKNQPTQYLTYSNLVGEGEKVLTSAQVYALGAALDAVHTRFSSVYADAAAVYAMDVEFKFDDEAAPGKAPTLYVKQARPYPGRGQ